MEQSSMFRETYKHKRYRHLRRGIFIGFAISVFVSILAYLGHFRPYENPFTAALQTTSSNKANDIALLFITEKEYKSGFNGTSPLARKRLAQIIDTLVSLQAKIIALDIDLSDETADDLILLESFKRASQKGVSIILPAVLSSCTEYQNAENDIGALRPYSLEVSQKNSVDFKVYNKPALLQAFQEISLHGGTLFSLERDGVLRNVEAFYLTTGENKIGESASSQPIPSFPLAIAAAYQGLSQKELVESLDKAANHTIQLNGKNDELQKATISFHYGKGGRITPTFIGNYEYFDRDVDIHQLLASYSSEDCEAKTIFADKIVLVGGVYDKRDFHFTPLGKMSGMEVIANVTQSVLNGTLISHLSFWKAFVLEVLIGFMVACIFAFTSSALKSTVICTILLMPLIIGASIWAFSASYYWFDFFPTYAGVMFHGIISKIEEKTHQEGSDEK